MFGLLAGSLVSLLDDVASIVLILTCYKTQNLFWGGCCLIIFVIATLVNWSFTLADHRGPIPRLLAKLLFDIPHLTSLVSATKLFLHTTSQTAPTPEERDTTTNTNTNAHCQNHDSDSLLWSHNSPNREASSLRVRLFFTALLHAVPKAVVLTYIALLHHTPSGEASTSNSLFLRVLAANLATSCLSFVLATLTLCLSALLQNGALLVFLGMVHVLSQFGLRTFALAILGVVFSVPAVWTVVACLWLLCLLLGPQGLFAAFCGPSGTSSNPRSARCLFVCLASIARTLISPLTFFLVVSLSPNHILGRPTPFSAFGARNGPFLLVRVFEDIGLVFASTVWSQRERFERRSFPHLGKFGTPENVLAVTVGVAFLALLSFFLILSIQESEREREALEMDDDDEEDNTRSLSLPSVNRVTANSRV